MHIFLRSFIAVLVFGTFAYSCQKDSEYDVLPVFEKYVQRFIKDAAARGIVIDFSDTGLSIQFRDAVSKESGGVCRGNHNIEIEKFFWDGLNELEKEGLIYHELGHCELGRPHRNDKLPNNEWASRMRGAPIPEGDNAVINYSGMRRQYYLDELFDEKTAFPDWSRWKMNYDEVLLDQKESLLSFVPDSSEFTKNVLELSNGNFEIEATLSSGTSEGFVGIQVLGSTNDDRIRLVYQRDKKFALDSGDQVWGFMFYRENYALINQATNKITLRRQGDFYYVFMNEQFVYWFDYKKPFSHLISSLNTGAVGIPKFLKIEAFRIP